jgi:hypothetical protein
MIWTSETQVITKRRAGSQTDNLIPDQKKSRINLIYLAAEGVQHIVEKLLMRATACLRPHFNPRFAHKVMVPQSHESPNLGDFGTPTWESRDKKPFGCGPRGEA